MKTNLRGKEVVGTTMNGKTVVGIGKRQDNDGIFIALSGYEDEYIEGTDPRNWYMAQEVKVGGHNKIIIDK